MLVFATMTFSTISSQVRGTSGKGLSLVSRLFRLALVPRKRTCGPFLHPLLFITREFPVLEGTIRTSGAFSLGEIIARIRLAFVLRRRVPFRGFVSLRGLSFIALSTLLGTRGRGHFSGRLFLRRFSLLGRVMLECAICAFCTAALQPEFTVIGPILSEMGRSGLTRELSGDRLFVLVVSSKVDLSLRHQGQGVVILVGITRHHAVVSVEGEPHALTHPHLIKEMITQHIFIDRLGNPGKHRVPFCQERLKVLITAALHHEYVPWCVMRTMFLVRLIVLVNKKEQLTASDGHVHSQAFGRSSLELIRDPDMVQGSTVSCSPKSFGELGIKTSVFATDVTQRAKGLVRLGGLLNPVPDPVATA